MQATSSPVVDIYQWLINQGPLGVALAVLAVLSGRIFRRYEEIQELRIKEAKDYGEKMERVAKSSVAATRKLYRALGEKDDDLDEEE